MNLGQFAMVLRAKYLIDVHSHTQVRGLPFRAAELAAVLQDVIDGTPAGTTSETADRTDTTILDTSAPTGAAL